MTERFKFRFWDKDCKKYVSNEKKRLNGLSLYINNPQSFVTEQYIGLKDKKGRLIYEGDILKTKDGCYCYVVWSECSFWVESPGSFAQDLEHEPFYSECEIVGNIHENVGFLCGVVDGASQPFGKIARESLKGGEEC